MIKIIDVQKKVAQGATPGYTCCLSRNMVLKKLTDLYEMLKRVEEPKAVVKHQEKWQMCVDKLFDISKKDIDKHLSAEDYLYSKSERTLQKYFWR